MKKKKFITKEKIYDVLFEDEKKNGLNKFGIMSSFSWDKDPKHLVFVLSRYKFVSKMFAGKKKVLEVGACDGWLSRVVKQNVRHLTVSDFDKAFLDFGKKNTSKHYPQNFLLHDMVNKPTKEKFDAIYALDVLEHISKRSENKFIKNVIKSLNNSGSIIIGCPSLESQKFTNMKEQGHVNCKSGKEFRSFFEKYFYNVYLFSMNDEVLHTGFEKMSHYLIALCTNPK